MKHPIIKALIVFIVVLEIAQIVMGIVKLSVSTADLVVITSFCVFAYGIIDWAMWELSELD